MTITRNRADTDNAGTDDHGGGIYTTGSSLTLINSIVARNTVGTTGMGPDCFGTITSARFSLIGNGAGCTIMAGKKNRIGVNPKLKALRHNGGFTMTHALRKGSPAVNRGSPKKSGPTACVKRDQRGVRRSDCDMGAFELA